jgi:hypothetical protein
MKKLIRLGVLLLVLLVAAVVGVSLFLGSLVRKGVETVGPQITKTDLKVGGMRLSLLSGRGEISGFLLGNPAGYHSSSAIEVRRASLALVPKSLFSEKIVIRSIQVEAPEITLEGGLKDNNLNKILENVKATTGGGSKTPTKPGEPKQQKTPSQTRIQVDQFILKEAKVHYAVPGLNGQKISVTLPAVELKNLGQDKEGITVAELTQKILEALNQQSVRAIGDSMTKLGQDPGKVIKDLSEGVLKDPGSTLETIGGLLQKKK